MKLNKTTLLQSIFVFFVIFGFAQDTKYNVKDHYTKQEVDIQMRDGIKLHTTIYSPKDTSYHDISRCTRTLDE